MSKRTVKKVEDQKVDAPVNEGAQVEKVTLIQRGKNWLAEKKAAREAAKNDETKEPKKGLVGKIIKTVAIVAASGAAGYFFGRKSAESDEDYYYDDETEEESSDETSEDTESEDVD